MVEYFYSSGCRQAPISDIRPIRGPGDCAIHGCRHEALMISPSLFNIAPHFRNALIPCPISPRYVPILWFDDQRVIDPNSAQDLLEEFLLCIDSLYKATFDGFMVSGTLAIVGSLLWSVFCHLKVKFAGRAKIG